MRQEIRLGYSVIDGARPAVPRIESGRAFFRTQIGRVLRKRGVGKVEIDTVRGSVERFRPGVSREPGEAVKLLQAHGGLQAIVGGIRSPGKDVHGSILRERRIVDSRVTALIRVVEARQF